MSKRILARGAAVLVLAGVAAGCHDSDAVVLGPRTTGANAIFQSYVALGNSLTAGYQSGGINDSTQRRAYPVLLAAQMHTRFAYPSLAMPGCAPPIDTFTTQHRVTPKGYPASTSTSCYLRDASFATDVLNNVAVPGAAVIDPLSASTANSNPLTTFILGGQTQVQRALDVRPTFATVWIGNNDVLPAALSGVLVPAPGVSPGVTPQATFTQNYDQMIAALTQGAPSLKGVLIGVVNVTNAPILFPEVLLTNPQFEGAFDIASGYNPASSDPYKSTPLIIDPNCTNQPTTLVSFLIAPQIAAFRNDSTKPAASRMGHPPTISCGPSTLGFPAPVGQVFILTPDEVTAVTGAVTAYNTYISQKAQSSGFAYFDPNTVLDSLRAKGQITPGPNFTPTTPFGKWISLDGIHPTSAAHVLLTNYLIDVINTKYGTSLAKLPNP